MKKAILTAVLSSGIPVLVQSAEPADKSPQAEQIAPNVQAFDKQMAQAQEYMNKMQEQMNNIRQTQDPQERQKLLQEHWATMQKNAQLMHNMWGLGGGISCCMQGGTKHDERVAIYGGPILQAYTGAIETAAVHDGSIRADATLNATPALYVGEVKARDLI